MPTKLSRYAEGIIEASWLAAIMIVPVFFNIYSSRIFEPDKITLLRTLSLIILAAWMVKLFEQGGFHWHAIKPEGGWLRTLLQVPLILPVIALVVVYIISTIFSVTPYTSLWGSYQRLQGTYTTFSYLVIFFALAANLRRRAQVERLITVAILSSLPVSLYGVLQHYQADPIPWGGDTTNRIAANLGNSIFVAAYLIMVFPLALMRGVESFEAMLAERGQLWPNFARATGYIFVLALQITAIYFSGSRGPWLGLGASLIVMWLGLSLVWKKRWLTISGVTLALCAAAFLVILNIPGGPLESLRNRSEFGRLGQLLDAESRTGRVRTLIWQGAAELVSPHEPLQFPDGRKDQINILRPLIGYGPESMYVAYNRFYPPELTQVEKRNASPDRSHNETWDSLVITGIFGLTVYLALFGSVLYYGLKWLGLVPGKKQRNLYLSLYLAGGGLSTIFFVLWGGLKFLGVALPFGMVLGAVFYMILISIFGNVSPSIDSTHRMRAYLIIGLLAAITAHFVEINFGIAIAATRISFWVYAGLLLLIGYILPLHGELFLDKNVQLVDQVNQDENLAEKAVELKSSNTSSRRKSAARRNPSKKANASSSLWLRSGLMIGLLVGLLLSTLGYLYISNTSRETTAIGLVWASLTQPARSGNRNAILPLMITSWLIGVGLLSSETVHSTRDHSMMGNRVWAKIMGLSAGLSLFIAFCCWLWNAANLASLGRESARTVEEIIGQVRASEGLLTTYYFQVFLILFMLAVLTVSEQPSSRTRSQALSVVLTASMFAAAFAFSAYSNLRVIQADIAFKTGDLFARPESWPVAIAIYNRANDLAPNEDYYYLFLGRAYLEYAKTLVDSTDRERLIVQAESDLHRAQEINPLNIDHTANLARLYSLWATFAQDPDLREDRGQKSAEYFEKALMLSPNSARLWDESAVLFLNVLHQPEEALPRLQHAREIDPYYDWTDALLGEFYNQVVAGQYQDQPEKRNEALATAAEYYASAIEKGKDTATIQFLYNYAIALGSINAQLNRLADSIQAYENALDFLPNSSDGWRVQIALAQLYAQQGDVRQALQYAEMALSTAPEEQKSTISDLILQLGGQP